MKEIEIKIEEGEDFFADEVSIINNPVRIVLDFKSYSPRQDRPEDDVRLIMKHNTIKMEPFLAKLFLENLQKQIKIFEERNGSIKLPKKIKNVDYLRKDEKDRKAMQSYVG